VRAFVLGRCRQIRQSTLSDLPDAKLDEVPIVQVVPHGPAIIAGDELPVVDIKVPLVGWELQKSFRGVLVLGLHLEVHELVELPFLEEFTNFSDGQCAVRIFDRRFRTRSGVSLLWCHGLTPVWKNIKKNSVLGTVYILCPK